MDRKIRVLIVDDAAFMVKAIKGILDADPDIEVVGTARNGEEALEQIKLLRPDAITLDVDMPVMDGLRTVRHIMIECPVPVVMLSSLFSKGDLTFESLRLGVVDFLPKPSGAISKDIHQARQQIVDRLKIAAEENIDNVHRVRLYKQDTRSDLTERYGFYPLEYLIAAGTTLGGPNSVIRLLSRLQPTIPAAMVAMQELSPKILPAFAARFDEYTAWKVMAGEDGQPIEQGVCYVCSYSEPMEVKIENDKAVLRRAPDGSAQPLDTLFSSAARAFEQNVLGLLLTGVGNDGTAGFSAIKEHGGVTLAQDAKTCVYPNLTENAITRGVVDHVVDIDNLANQLERFFDQESEQAIS